MTNTETLASQTRQSVTAATILSTAVDAGEQVNGLGERTSWVDLSYSLEAIFTRCGYTLPAKGHSRAK